MDLEYGEPRPFGASDGRRYSSTGQGLPYDAEGTQADSRLSSNAEWNLLTLYMGSIMGDMCLRNS